MCRERWRFCGIESVPLAEMTRPAPAGLFYCRLRKAAALADAILRDRERRKFKVQQKPTRTCVTDDFDPFSVQCWRVVAGGDPGCLPKTPMRKGPIVCAREFESKAWRYCSACIELPAEERRARPVVSDRHCQNCGSGIPKRRRTDANTAPIGALKPPPMPAATTVAEGYARNSSTKSSAEKRPNRTERFPHQRHRRLSLPARQKALAGVRAVAAIGARARAVLGNNAGTGTISVTE
jgi:hypothetical protein